MKWLIILLLNFFAVSYSSGEFNPAEHVLSDKVITASRNNDSSSLSEADYEKITEYLSQGRTHWIELYTMLNRAPFSGATSFQEGLDIAMALALSENPEAVLKYVNQSNVSKLCGMPFIEPTPDETEAYFLKARAVLTRLTSENELKRRCLTVLEKSHAHLAVEIRQGKGALQ